MASGGKPFDKIIKLSAIPVVRRFHAYFAITVKSPTNARLQDFSYFTLLNYLIKNINGWFEQNTNDFLICEVQTKCGKEAYLVLVNLINQYVAHKTSGLEAGGKNILQFQNGELILSFCESPFGTHPKPDFKMIEEYAKDNLKIFDQINDTFVEINSQDLKNKRKNQTNEKKENQEKKLRTVKTVNKPEKINVEIKNENENVDPDRVEEEKADNISNDHDAVTEDLQENPELLINQERDFRSVANEMGFVISEEAQYQNQIAKQEKDYQDLRFSYEELLEKMSQKGVFCTGLQAAYDEKCADAIHFKSQKKVLKRFCLKALEKLKLEDFKDDFNPNEFEYLQSEFSNE